MADEEKNIEETDVPEAAETVDEAAVPAPEEVSDTSAEEPETAAPSAEAAAEEPAAEPEAEAEEPAAEPVGKPAKSQRHVPRSLRRTRSKIVREKPAARRPITRTSAPDPELGRRQERRGVVVSDKGEKTIIVKVDVIKSHRKYRKVVRRSVRFHAHDESNQAGVGDTVRIVETRPLSKLKRWRLAEIVEKAK
jgi:small subunit ribosomal protein S17